MSEFWFTLKRLFLGVALILAAAAVLLTSDLRSRKSAKTGPAPADTRTFKVAMIQHASQSVLDDGAKGMIAGLAEKGFVEGKNLVLKRFNAEGDLPTANAIAKEVVSADYDLVLTISTLSMQTVANANRSAKTKHVFGLVSDPYAAGVGINRENPAEHPPYMTGYSTMQPVAASFRIAREVNPQLSRVGVVWNPAEANSEAQIKVARVACAELKIELLEATVDNSAGVGEAANALIGRGVEAIWAPGDVCVLTAAEALLLAGKKARIPVFTVIPPHAERGALFDVGANYTEVGRVTGNLGGDVLAGKDPATIPVSNLVPEMLVVNKVAVKDLKDRWEVPAALAERADVLIDETGKHRKNAPVASNASGPLSKKWRVHMVNYNDSAAADEAVEGLMDGLKSGGLVLDRDFSLKHRNAQGDVATLNNIFDSALAEGADIFLILSTPTLQVAIKKVREIPVVFTYVANPMLAGAGTDYTNHLPNVTGVSSMGAFGPMADLLAKHYPQYKRVGTLFCPAEINSVYHKDVFAADAARRGIKVEAVAVNTPSDLPDASVALCSLGVDAIVQISDNLSAAGFSSIGRAAQRARIPLFSFNSTTIQHGAAVVISRDYHQGGVEAAEAAVRIMRGADPAKIPFALISKTKLLVHSGNAAALEMPLPAALKAEAEEVK